MTEWVRRGIGIRAGLARASQALLGNERVVLQRLKGSAEKDNKNDKGFGCHIFISYNSIILHMLRLIYTEAHADALLVRNAEKARLTGNTLLPVGRAVLHVQRKITGVRLCVDGVQHVEDPALAAAEDVTVITHIILVALHRAPVQVIVAQLPRCQAQTASLQRHSSSSGGAKHLGRAVGKLMLWMAPAPCNEPVRPGRGGARP